MNEVLEQQQFKRAEQFAGQFDPFEQLDQPSFVNIANSNVCKIYIAITFTQNTILTGMIGKLNMHISIVHSTYSYFSQLEDCGG